MGAMDVGICSRHSGAQPGGGICAICLQEKLILLWRGEGNSNWDTEEFSVTPPLELLAGSKSPPVDEPSPAEDALRDATAPSTHVYQGVTASACFPVLFRVRHRLRRDDVLESSKEREKIDRSSRLADGASDREREFSCELKSIMKELSGLHEKKKSFKSEKAAAKIRSSGTESGCFSGRRPQHEEVAADVSQRAATSAQQSGTEDATAVLAPPAETAATSHRIVPKARAASVAFDDDINDDDDNSRSYAKSLQCFSVLWPALVNMKWARALMSPIVSSNKIAPSKSDLLAKMVNGGVPGGKAAGVVGESEARAESGRNCESSGENYEFERGMDHFGGESGGGAAGVVAVLPPRWAQPVADEDGTVLELDKETKLRMEASRITVMTWLESLPSPKAVQLTELSHQDAIPEDLSLGNGVLEMCDEEEVFDIQSQEETAMTAGNVEHETSFEFANDLPSEPPQASATSIEFANEPPSEPPQASTTSFEFANDPPSEPPQASATSIEFANEPPSELPQASTTSFEFANDPPSEPPQASSAAHIYAHMSSFGKFLRTPSEQIHAPTRMVDIEIVAQ